MTTSTPRVMSELEHRVAEQVAGDAGGHGTHTGDLSRLVALGPPRASASASTRSRARRLGFRTVAPAPRWRRLRRRHRRTVRGRDGRRGDAAFSPVNLPGAGACAATTGRRAERRAAYSRCRVAQCAPTRCRQPPSLAARDARRGSGRPARRARRASVRRASNAYASRSSTRPLAGVEEDLLDHGVECRVEHRPRISRAAGLEVPRPLAVSEPPHASLAVRRRWVASGSGSPAAFARFACSRNRTRPGRSPPGSCQVRQAARTTCVSSARSPWCSPRRLTRGGSAPRPRSAIRPALAPVPTPAGAAASAPAESLCPPRRAALDR